LGTILKLDTDNGDVVNELGYLELNKASPSDLAIDNKGNIYVLLNASPENTAVYIYDSFGSLKHRLGKLTYGGEGWMEGVFFFPVGISISPDGRFLSVVENGFLTTYLLDVDI
jgi:sugar lactone lactonase YvrE